MQLISDKGLKSTIYIEVLYPKIITKPDPNEEGKVEYFKLHVRKTSKFLNGISLVNGMRVHACMFNS